MSENQDNTENEEPKQQTPENQTTEQEEPKEEPAEKAEDDQAPDIKTEENQANWKKFREEREKDRKAKLEAEEQAKRKAEEAQAMKEAMEALLNKPQTQSQYQNDEYDDYETDEQRVARLVKEQLENERKAQDEAKQKEEAKKLPQKLASEYKDFGNVCNSENLDYLEYHHPEIALAFSQMPESYDKWSSVYKAVKKLVPYSNKGEDQARMEKNLSKPQASTPSVADASPAETGWKLTEKRRMDNWRRMQQDMRSM